MPRHETALSERDGGDDCFSLGSLSGNRAFGLPEFGATVSFHQVVSWRALRSFGRVPCDDSRMPCGRGQERWPCPERRLDPAAVDRGDFGPQRLRALLPAAGG